MWMPDQEFWQLPSPLLRCRQSLTITVSIAIILVISFLWDSQTNWQLGQENQISLTLRKQKRFIFLFYWVKCSAWFMCILPSVGKDEQKNDCIPSSTYCTRELDTIYVCIISLCENLCAVWIHYSWKIAPRSVGHVTIILPLSDILIMTRTWPNYIFLPFIAGY